LLESLRDMVNGLCNGERFAYCFRGWLRRQ
jgi:hypothetical protein